MKAFTLFIPGILMTLLLSCTDENPSSNCDKTVLINDNHYDEVDADFFTFIDVNIEGDCLMVGYAASGCDGNSWNIKLVASTAVAESFPVQRYIKVDFENPEDCLAHFTKMTSFDLSPLQLDEYDTIILNLESYDKQITYMY